MVSIKLRVIPKSGTQAVEYGESGWKVRLKALPEAGKANKELVRILAKFFDVTQSDIRILRGTGSRDKTVEISGITSEELGEKKKIAG